MARARMTKKDARKLVQYGILTNAIYHFADGVWTINTPDSYEVFYTTPELIEYVGDNLEWMREAYEANGELAEWEIIAREAEKTPFRLGGEFDRMLEQEAREMIKYYVSTIDYYENGEHVGNRVIDSAWSADVEGEAESEKDALEKETRWVAAVTEDNDREKTITEIDTERGYIFWEDTQGMEYRTEVSIDTFEE